MLWPPNSQGTGQIPAGEFVLYLPLQPATVLILIAFAVFSYSAQLERGIQGGGSCVDRDGEGTLVSYGREVLV